MKAADIRLLNQRCQEITGKPTLGRKEQEIGLESLKISMLTEIAAQLAEANEHLAKIANPVMVVDAESPWVWLKLRGVPFVVDRNEVTGVELMDSGLGSDNPKVSIGMKGQPWLTTADGTVVEVCKKLNIPIGG